MVKREKGEPIFENLCVFLFSFIFFFHLSACFEDVHLTSLNRETNIQEITSRIYTLVPKNSNLGEQKAKDAVF